jgi:transglutaminase-like putative cysteine protease
MMNIWRFILAITLATVFVGLELEHFVLIAGLSCIVWKCKIEFWGLAKPSRWLTNGLTVVALVAVLLHYRTLASQESSSSFLLILTCLKLLEERTLRDQKFLFLLGSVLIASLFLFSIELPALTAGIASFFFLWTAQNKFVQYRWNFLKTIPFVLLLFLFFPRVQNPFGLQGFSGGDGGTTGFSDDLNPGSISKIQSSQELAFRVQFLNSPMKPRTGDQYWRGKILNVADGLHWTSSRDLTRDRTSSKFTDADYEVTLEPQHKRWIIALEPTQAIQSADFAYFVKGSSFFESVAPIHTRVTYQGKVAEPSAMASYDDSKDLIAPRASPELLHFVQDMKQNSRDREDFVSHLLAYYKNQGFSYTKSPGQGSSTIENFFFKNKKGYCEHYAATTAALLRIAAIPAHVVTGYQGGQYNAYGKFWKFAQADAHAWVEYLDDKNKWQRVDPTSVVAPERLELGGLLFSELPEEWIGQNKTAEFLKSRQAWWLTARDFLDQGLESLNYDLVLFLIDFNLEKQKDLLREYTPWAVALAFLLLLPFVVQSIWQRRPRTFSEWLLRELDRRASEQKLVRAPAETLRRFCQRWSEVNPKLAGPLATILEAYEKTEYGNTIEKPERKKLKHLLRELKI